MNEGGVAVMNIVKNIVKKIIIKLMEPAILEGLEKYDKKKAQDLTKQLYMAELNPQLIT